MSQELAKNNFKLKMVSMSARHSWQLGLDNDIRLELGRDDPSGRLARFEELYPALQQQAQATNQRISYVDLRYDTGAAVGWAPAPLDQQTQQTLISNRIRHRLNNNDQVDGQKLVVGLEIGTAKVAALVGEVLPDGMVNIIGVGSCPSRGMDKGGVNDLESVVKCVQRAIDQAELMADCQISSVYLALSGKHISCQNEIGMVPISEEEVTLEDVENVVHTAKSVRVRDEHRVLHVIPQEYAIDYQEGIKIRLAYLACVCKLRFI